MLNNRLKELPPQTRQSVEVQLELLDQVEGHIQVTEKQIREVVAATLAMKLLMTMPGGGPRHGDWRGEEISRSGAFGELCGYRTPDQVERREKLLRQGPTRREPIYQVGLG